MADNFAFTPGTGATAAADDIGGVLFQRAKITAGKDGENVGDVGGSLVDTDRVALYVRERPKLVEFTPSVTVNTAAYTAGNCLGGLITIASVVAAAGDVFRVERIFAAGKANMGGLTVYLFNANPTATTFTDHAAFPAIDDADMGKLRVLQPTTNTDDGTVYTSHLSSGLPDMPLVATSLYLALKVAGTPDFVNATDLKLSVVGVRL